jgi:hypothetical protein
MGSAISLQQPDCIPSHVLLVHAFVRLMLVQKRCLEGVQWFSTRLAAKWSDLRRRPSIQPGWAVGRGCCENQRVWKWLIPYPLLLSRVPAVLRLMASQKLTNCCVAAIALVTAAYLSTPRSSTIARLAFGAFCLAIHSLAFLRKHQGWPVGVH